MKKMDQARTCSVTKVEYWTVVSKTFLMPDGSLADFQGWFRNSTFYYYLASNCRQTEASQKLDQDERIEVALMSPSELIAAAHKGAVSDAVAVLLAYDRLRSLESLPF